MEASREIFWQIPFGVQIALYLSAIIAVLLICYVVYKRYRMWMIGRPENRFDNPGKRIGEFIKITILDGIFHRRFFRDPYPGIMHFLIFVGCAFLFIGAGLDFLNHYFFEMPFNAPFIRGPVYIYLGGLWNLAGVMVLAGLLMAFFRRYIQRPKRLNTVLDDGIALLLILIVVVSGFFLQAFRMIAAIPENLGLTQPEYYVHPEWSQMRFVSYWLAGMFAGLPEVTRVLWYKILWYFHVIFTVGTVVYIILSWEKLTHILISPVNVLFKTSRPKGALSYINLETAETYGVGKIEDFTWKQIFDLDACTNCGRCQDRCPAYLTDKPLSPRKVVQDLKAHWLERSPSLLALQKAKAKAGGNGAETATPPQTDGNGVKSMVGEVITEDEIWSCTTCRACQDICPVFIEHIDKIIDMRRHLVLDLAQVPETGEAVLKCIEARGHSCKGTTLTRTDWTTGLGIKQLSEDSNVDYVFFTGCAASLEERSTKIAIATAKILLAAGVKFGILGSQEMCCGEPARRLGNEYLFQTLAAQNVELFKGYNIKKIITMCPHCFNTLKNEYPQFDGNFEVIHHSTFISQLITDGKIKPADLRENKITYHDSCYLGRHNDIFDPQRHVVQSINKLPLIEMERSRNSGFCCGAGGGRFWMEERIGKRISEARIEQVMETGAEIVASACPYCVQMFTDAIKAKGAEETLKAYDIAELVIESLEGAKK